MDACAGAWPHAYPKWFFDHGGMGLHEVDYPYLDRFPEKHCHKAKSERTWNSGAKVNNAVYDFQCDAEKMKALVAANGAVLAVLDASHSGFHNYKSGVFQGCRQVTSFDPQKLERIIIIQNFLKFQKLIFFIFYFF